MAVPSDRRRMSTDTDDGETRELDAREIDGEPFGEIVAELRALPEGATLVLVNGFEPEPLYDVLERRGFAHETSRVADDEWRVSITHDRTGSGQPPRGSPSDPDVHDGDDSRRP